MCFSLEHQNPSKTSEIMGYFDRVDDRVTVSLHILYTANQETKGSQDRLIVLLLLRFRSQFTSVTKCCGSHRTKSRGTSFLPCPFFLLGTSCSVALRATCRAPARLWLAVIDFQNGEQQSRSGSDKKRRNRLQ